MKGPTELALPLTDLSHLFNAPRVDPFSRSPAEVLGTSGLDYLFGLLHMERKQARASKLVILLPPARASAASAEQTTLALHRVIDHRLERERRELRGNYRYGWKVAGIAVVLLALCLAVSSLFGSDVTAGMRPLVRRTSEYGFEIVGWVLLWHPIDVLGFMPLAFHLRIRTLQALRSMAVEIRPDEPLPPSGPQA
jgi:hypothetical protein